MCSDQIPGEKNSRLNIVHYAVIFFYSISPLLYFLRTWEKGSFIVSVLLRSIEPLLIMITAIAILYHGFFRVNKYIIVMLIVTGYAVSVGLIMGNEARYVLGGLSHVLAGLLLFWYMRCHNHSEELLERFLKTTIKVTIYFFAISIIVLLKSKEILGVSLYIGLASQVLLLAVFWAFQYRASWSLLASLGLIFMSGKRGVIVAAAFGMLIMTGASLIKRGKTILKLGSIGLVALLLLNLIGVNVVQSRSVKKVISFTETGLTEYSSGRLDEIKSALGEWKSQPLKVVFGSGFGFSYTYIYSDEQFPDVPNYHNVHFSPLNVLIIWGVPLSLFILICFTGMLWKIRGPLVGPGGVARVTVYALVFYSFFVFNIFNEPLLWTLVGMLSGIRSKNHLLPKG